MGQIKIFGLAKTLNTNKKEMSEVIHSCVMDAFKYPADKCFHRFFPMDEENFIFPSSRTDKYTIIEISVFEGRSVEAKKELVRLLYSRFKERLAVEADDLEITIFETPKYNWGIRGVPGDELALNYKVNV
jgi:phenylpyruvate tautomerase PptA (4-oxalocrotonate tautomerase family)